MALVAIDFGQQQMVRWQGLGKIEGGTGLGFDRVNIVIAHVFINFVSQLLKVGAV